MKKKLIQIIGLAVAIIAGGYFFLGAGAVGCDYKIGSMARNDAATDISNTLNSDTALNNSVESVFKNIETYQFSYILLNPMYWQGFRTHDTPVAYGESVAGDNLPCHPARVKENWNDTKISPATLPFQVEVHEYVT